MKDIMGIELSEDDYVIKFNSDSETPRIFKVIGFTSKKVRLAALNAEVGNYGLRYPNELLIIDPEILKAKLAETPRDLLGQELAIGDLVAANNGVYIDMLIYRIVEFLPGLIKTEHVYGNNCFGTYTTVSTNFVKVDAETVTMLLLKRDKNE